VGALLTVNTPFAMEVTFAARALLTVEVTFTVGALLAVEARFHLPVTRPVLRGCWPCLRLRPCLWLVSRSYRSRGCRMSSLFCQAKP
jgi:hypothetical protein